MPRIHPREQMVILAELALKRTILEWRKTDDARELTDGEFIRVVSGAFSDVLGGWAKYAIRAERHPDDPDQPGGWE